MASRVNASGITYHYVAWNEIAGKVDVGTYTGNAVDNRNIPGVGFQPDFVMVQTDSDGSATTDADGGAFDGEGPAINNLALLHRGRKPERTRFNCSSRPVSRSAPPHPHK